MYEIGVRLCNTAVKGSKTQKELLAYFDFLLSIAKKTRTTKDLLAEIGSLVDQASYDYKLFIKEEKRRADIARERREATAGVGESGGQCSVAQPPINGERR
jgi:hypothetical protein